MHIQEQIELQSEENARWDYIAILKEESRDHADYEPFDRNAWKAHCAKLNAERPGIPESERMFDQNGQEINF